MFLSFYCDWHFEVFYFIGVLYNYWSLKRKLFCSLKKDWNLSTLCKVIDVSVILFHDSISPMNITFRGFYSTNSIQSLPKVYHTMIMSAFFNLIFLISTALIRERAQVLKNKNVVIDYSLTKLYSVNHLHHHQQTLKRMEVKLVPINQLTGSF
jgi:hypothetical protein